MSNDDWRSLVLLARDYHYPPPQLAAEILGWLQGHPGEWLYRSIFLEAIRKQRANLPEFSAVLDRMLEWFDQAGQNIFREHLLRAVTDFGSDAQAFKAIEQSARWLESARNDARLHDEREVRTAYVRLVRRRGTPLQVTRGLKDTEQWLKLHPDDVRVREPFIALVRTKGAPGDWKRTIEATERWLEDHDSDQNVRAAFIKLVAERGNNVETERAIRCTRDWLSTHDGRNFLRKSYSGLLMRDPAHL